MRRLLAIALSFLVCAPLARGGEPTSFEQYADEAVVGPLGNLEKLEFLGLKHFSAEQLREQLKRDLRLQQATRPSGPLRRLVTQLENALVCGYAQSGCPDAKMSFALSDNGEHLMITVESGSRYKAGDIRVLDAPGGVVPAVCDRLVSPRSADLSPRSRLSFYESGEPFGHSSSSKTNDDNAPLWRPDEPAPCSAQHFERVRAAVAHQLAVLGYPLAKFEVRVEPTDDTHADLVIDLSDHGPVAQVDSVWFDGLSQHSYSDLYAFLDLQEGEPFDFDKVVQACDRLQNSGRFWNYDVKVRFEQPDVAGPFGIYLEAPTRIEIELTEFRHAAKLGEELDEVHQILQRAGTWAEQFLQQDEWDLRVNYTRQESPDFEVTVDAIVSPDDGLIANCQAIQHGEADAVLWDVTAVNTADLCGVTDLAGQSRWSMPRSLPWVPTFSMTPAQVEDGAYKTLLTTRLARRTSHHAVQPVNLNIDPLTLLNFAHRKDANWKIEDGELIIRQLDTHARLDVATGRLIELETWTEHGTEVNIVTQPRGKEFQRQLAVFTKLPNACDDQRRLGSLLSWALESLDQFKSPEPFLPPATRDCLEQFARSPALQAWEDNLAGLLQADTQDADAFQLADSPPASHYLRDRGALGVIVEADWFFVRGTWPWTATREYAFFVSSLEGNRQQYAAQIREIYRVWAREDSGPLFCWGLMQLFESHQAGIADWGLRQFEDDSFDREVDMLTTPNTGMMEVLKHAVPLVQSLPDHETVWLCDLAGGDLSPQLLEACRLLRKLDATTDATLQASLAELLRGEIRDRVEADLQAAADAPFLTLQQDAAN